MLSLPATVVECYYVDYACLYCGGPFSWYADLSPSCQDRVFAVDSVGEKQVVLFPFLLSCLCRYRTELKLLKCARQVVGVLYRLGTSLGHMILMPCAAASR